MNAFTKDVKYDDYVAPDCRDFIVPDDPDDPDQAYTQDEKDVSNYISWGDISMLG